MSRQIDAQRAEAFSEKMVGVLNGAAIALMTSIGHRTGLFDVMSGMPPADAEKIAGEAGLSERYVREWLGAMVTAGVVEYDPARRSFALPAEHAAFLCREARPNNLAATTQWVALLGGVEDDIVECFERGGGVPYSAFGRFHAVMAEESDQTVVAVLEDAILPIVPGLKAALERGIDVLDVGCGSGRAVNLLARRFPKSRFAGFDMLPEAIAAAKVEALAHGLRNVRFEVRDVSEVDLALRFDLITAFDAIHDQARPDAVLAAVAKALRQDGVFLMQDIAGTSHLEHDAKHPLAPFLYTVSCMHCMTVSLAQGGEGLGAMWGRETASRMLEAAGFAKPEVVTLPHDPINQYYVARRRG
ncbi:MAG TPA: class I SAM-dependent methyltransferase [Myxococcota bacterium]|nr:class I SAM-dependent methyltransferase [Myxococcota bacterium]